MLSRSNKPYPSFFNLSTNGYFPRFWKPYYLLIVLLGFHPLPAGEGFRPGIQALDKTWMAVINKVGESKNWWVI